MEKKLYYDLHCHSQASVDSPSPIKEIVSIAKKRGLDGVAITDHDCTYQGETMIDGLQIIPGNEISLKNGGHLLAFFVEKNFKRNLDLKEAVAEIKKQGGYAVLAHPFRREHSYLTNKSPDEIKEALEIVDGLEAGNASDADQSRNSALNLKSDSVFLTAGSDAHMTGQVGFGVVAVKEKLTKDNFSQVLAQAEIMIRPESEDFRKKTFFWKDLLLYSPIANLLKMLGIGRLRKALYLLVLRNYLRFNNRKFSKINFNSQENE
jgi:predicted metal-dependent phosphoesterase TrpH